MTGSKEKNVMYRLIDLEDSSETGSINIPFTCHRCGDCCQGVFPGNLTPEILTHLGLKPTEEEAQKAIEKFNQSTFKDRTIVVNEAREREDRDKFRGNRDQNRDSFRDRKDKDNLDSKLRQLRKKFNK